MSNKPRILFPYIEAGSGHIMPMHAFVDTFRKKYGDEFEIIESDFYKEDKDKDLLAYERFFCDFVRRSARHPFVGYFSCYASRSFPIRYVSWSMMRIFGWKSYKKCIQKMKDFNADVVFSTHWATNYYAMKLKPRPITIQYCPDCTLNPLFSYPNDLNIISTEVGLQKGLKNRHRFNSDNLKKSSFLIRPHVFSIPMDRYENRRNLGLPEHKFTVMIMEGGYGVGHMRKLCKELAQSDLELTIVAACGKSKENFEYINQLKTKPNVTLIPLKETERVLEYMASCDMFIAKSGASSMAEPTFFGHLVIAATISTTVEKDIARYYSEDVGNAIVCTNTKKILTYIKDFAKYPEKLKPYEEAALKEHARFGAEPVVDLVYQTIQEKLAERNNPHN